MASSIFVEACEIFSCGVWDLVPDQGTNPGPRTGSMEALPPDHLAHPRGASLHLARRPDPAGASVPTLEVFY